MLPIFPQNITFSWLMTHSSRKLHPSTFGKYRGLRDLPLFTPFGLYPANFDQNLLMFVASYNLRCLPIMVRLAHLYCFLLVSLLMWFASVEQSWKVNPMVILLTLSMFANLGRCLPMFANVCQCLPIITNPKQSQKKTKTFRVARFL